jgi:sugar phosphate isomerase/epimerase
MGGVDPTRLSLHTGTLRPVPRFEEKAALAAQAGFGAWALRVVELEGYLAEGRTIGEVRQLNEKHGLTISETGSLMQWQFSGGSRWSTASRDRTG